MHRIRLRRCGTRTEHLFAMFRRLLWEVLFPIRRHIMAAVALLFVVSSVLLVLEARLPFPSPGESILLDPTDWSMLFHRDPPLRRAAGHEVARAVRGGLVLRSAAAGHPPVPGSRG